MLRPQKLAQNPSSDPAEVDVIQMVDGIIQCILLNEFMLKFMVSCGKTGGVAISLIFRCMLA